MASTVTVKEIAQGAEVSVATVSRVLNNQANVREEIRQRVLKTAASLGYFASLASKGQHFENINSNKSLKEIGFIYSSSIDSEGVTVNPFWLSILQGAEREANKSSIKMTYRSVNELLKTPHFISNVINEMHLDGILLVGPAEVEIVKIVQSLGLPLVLVDNYTPQVSVDAVLSDNFEGARQAVDFLIEQGHSRIAFIGGPVSADTHRPINKIYTIERRAAGFRTAVLDAGLSIDYNLYEAANLTPEGGYAACKRLLAQRANFSAIFCTNDMTAIGAMKALREADLEIPHDVAVVGFDDLEISAHYNPTLTTVRVNKEGMGAAAVKALISRANDPIATNLTVLLDVELVVRDSVCRYKSINKITKLVSNF